LVLEIQSSNFTLKYNLRYMNLLFLFFHLFILLFIFFSYTYFGPYRNTENRLRNMNPLYKLLKKQIDWEIQNPSIFGWFLVTANHQIKWSKNGMVNRAWDELKESLSEALCSRLEFYLWYEKAQPISGRIDK
jgi:hypothetical protein